MLDDIVSLEREELKYTNDNNYILDKKSDESIFKLIRIEEIDDI